MNDMIGVYEKELAYLKEGQDTLGLEDVGVIPMEEHYVTRFTEYGLGRGLVFPPGEIPFLEKLISFCKLHITTLRDTSFYSMTAEKMDMLAVVLNDNIDYLSEINEDDPDPATTRYIEDCEEALTYIQRLPREN